MQLCNLLSGTNNQGGGNGGWLAEMSHHPLQHKHIFIKPPTGEMYFRLRCGEIRWKLVRLHEHSYEQQCHKSLRGVQRLCKNLPQDQVGQMKQYCAFKVVLSSILVMILMPILVIHKETDNIELKEKSRFGSTKLQFYFWLDNKICSMAAAHRCK